MKILALDIATNLGYADENMSGAYDLQKGPMKEKNRYYNLYWFIRELLIAGDYDIISIERTAGRHAHSMNIQSRLRGVVELLARIYDCEIIDYSAMTIKKFYAGHGHANKPQMVEEFIRRKGYEPVDDNEADAHALYELTKSRLNEVV